MVAMLVTAAKASTLLMTGSAMSSAARHMPHTALTGICTFSLITCQTLEPGTALSRAKAYSMRLLEVTEDTVQRNWAISGMILIWEIGGRQGVTQCAASRIPGRRVVNAPEAVAEAPIAVARLEHVPEDLGGGVVAERKGAARGVVEVRNTHNEADDVRQAEGECHDDGASGERDAHAGRIDCQHARARHIPEGRAERPHLMMPNGPARSASLVSSLMCADAS